jgi:dTDP-4-dehydrorhamnose 3,5-epimerase
MIFKETTVDGVFVVSLEVHQDERGFFARSWCETEFREHGLNPKIVQCSVSVNDRKGTLRGVHYQAEPNPEAKLVRCTRGSLFDVALDLRPGSATYLKWTGVELTAANHQALYIPKGCAHGFLTLEDDTEALYQMSEFYHPEGARGVRWNDPSFGIVWPGKVEVISDRDRMYPDFESR